MATEYLIGNIKGIKGDKGDTGLQGVRGEQGIQGLSGATGATGAKGDKGDTGLQGIQGIQGVRGATGATGATGAKGDKGDAGSGGGQSVYDLVIRTQVEFDAMINSSDWLGAKSVCIIGGKYTFASTFDIPSCVVTITGIGNVELEFSNLPVRGDNYCFNSKGSCSISNINIKINTDYEGTYGCFKGFGEVANCKARFNCNIDRMTPEGYENELSLIGFSCSNLINCNSDCYVNGTLNGALSGNLVSYLNCYNIINCDASISHLADAGGNGLSVFNFKGCLYLLNCSGLAEVNQGEGYIFYDCSFLNNCYPSMGMGTFLGGANTHVDTSTVSED